MLFVFSFSLSGCCLLFLIAKVQQILIPANFFNIFCKYFSFGAMIPIYKQKNSLFLAFLPAFPLWLSCSPSVVVCSCFLRCCLQSFAGLRNTCTTPEYLPTDRNFWTGIFTKKGASVIFISSSLSEFLTVAQIFCRKKPQSRQIFQTKVNFYLE